MSATMLGLERGWIVRSHVDWREERVRAKTLGSEWGGDREIPPQLGRRTKHFFIRV